MANLLINQGTNSAINFDLSGTVNTQVVALSYGTVSTIGTLPNVPGGTIGNLATGTINAVQFLASGSLTDLTRLYGGTLNNLASGTINAATVVLNSGTVNVGTFVMPSGTVTTGTILSSGTSTGVGTVTNLGSVTNLGQVYNAGTVQTILAGTVTNLVSGTINSATVVLNSGTINVGTVVNNGGTINLGTTVGKDANAAAQTGNPIGIGGTDSGGTIRTIKVDSGGLQRVGLDSGTLTVMPNIPGGTLTNLVSGTINSATVVLNSGTINVATVTLNSGTINVGTVVNNGGSAIAYGAAAAAAAAVGNPVNIGGTDSGGTIRTIKVDSGGLQRMGLDSGTVTVLQAGTINTLSQLPGTAALADTTTNGTLSQLQVFPMIYNSSTWDRVRGIQADSAGVSGILAAGPVTFNEFNYDRVRGNVQLTWISSGTRNTTQTQGDQTNYNSRGMKMAIAVTALTGAGTIVPEIDGKDPTSSSYYSLLKGANITGVGTIVLSVYPGMTNTANIGTSDFLPRMYRMLMTQTGSGTFTYSVGWDLVV